MSPSRLDISLLLLTCMVASSWAVVCLSDMAKRNFLIPMEDHENYFMVFRLQSNVNKSSYDDYIYSLLGFDDDYRGLYFDYVMPCTCKIPNGHVFCNAFFRSRLLSLWYELQIEKVRVGVYEGKKEVAFFLFNAEGADYINWFNQSRLIDSRYQDLATASPNFFSILGDQTYKRRFFINNNYGGCLVDAGWLVVVDTANPPCAWEGAGKDFPTIWYSPGFTMTNYQTGAKRADVLVISVKFKDNFCSCYLYDAC